MNNRKKVTEKLVGQFKQAIDTFDADDFAQRGVPPKAIKAMKDGLVSQYNELQEELDKMSKAPKF